MTKGEERKAEQGERKRVRAMRRRDDPGDLTDAEWKILERVIPPAKEGGKPRTTERRDVLTAIFSIDRTGCP